MRKITAIGMFFLVFLFAFPKLQEIVSAQQKTGPEQTPESTLVNDFLPLVYRSLEETPVPALVDIPWGEGVFEIIDITINSEQLDHLAGSLYAIQEYIVLENGDRHIAAVVKTDLSPSIHGSSNSSGGACNGFASPCEGCSLLLPFGTYPNNAAFGILAGTAHNGFDLYAGGAVFETYAVFEGDVVASRANTGVGWLINIVSTEDPSWEARYYHIDGSSYHVEKNYHVECGELMGMANGSGTLSSGIAHLHFELLHNGSFVNPADYVDW